MSKYRKKRYARGKRSRRMRRRVRRVKKSRGRRSRLHHFKRTATGTFTATKAVSGIAGITTNGTAFSLQDVPNFLEFSNLYDTYRINKVVVKFIPRTTSNAQGANERGNFYSCIDYNDNDVSGLTVAAILERHNVRKTRSTSTHTRVITPALSAAAFRVGLSNGYAPRWKQWVDMTYPGVTHYGLKCIVVNPDDIDIVYDYFITYYMSFKHVR